MGLALEEEINMEETPRTKLILMTPGQSPIRCEICRSWGGEESEGWGMCYFVKMMRNRTDLCGNFNPKKVLEE